MLITDEEVLDELKLYNEQIHLVTLSERETMWPVQYTVLVISNIFLYFSQFIVTPVGANNRATLVPSNTII